MNIEDSNEYLLKGNEYFNILREQRKQYCNYIDINTFLSELKGEEHIALVEPSRMNELTMVAYPLIKKFQDEVMRIYNSCCLKVKDIQNDIGLTMQKPLLEKNLKNNESEKDKEQINARKTVYDEANREKYYVFSYYLRFTLLIIMISGVIHTFIKGNINLISMGAFILFFVLFFSPIQTLISIIFTKYDNFIAWKNNPVKKL